MSFPKAGLGCEQPRWVLYIANRPELDEYQDELYRILALGEAAEIIRQTSNHWRKVFSIMAKISFALYETQCATWQEYRDTKLLTEHGFEAISFEPFQQLSDNHLSLICGFTYAETQIDLTQLISHHKFEKLKVSEIGKLIVTPYFDWRQLNNEMLTSLISIMKGKGS